MPETRGRSLEDIQEAFQRPALSGASRYLRHIVPGMRHRAPETRSPIDEEIEMEPRDQTVPVEATSVSLEGMTRSLRLDVSA